MTAFNGLVMPLIVAATRPFSDGCSHNGQALIPILGAGLAGTVLATPGLARSLELLPFHTER